MKKLSFILISIICLSLILTCPVFCEESQSGQSQSDEVQNDELPGDGYHRSSDSTGALSKLQVESLDKMCYECLSEYNVDLAVLSVMPEEYEDGELYDLALAYYEDNNCGYGDSRDCIIFICDVASQKAVYYEFGNIHGEVPDSYYEFAAERSLGYKESNGMFGVLYAGGRFIYRYLENRAESKAAAAAENNEDNPADEATDEAGADGIDETVTEGEGSDGSEINSDAADKAGTGERTPENFVPHHDETAPRVTDKADIFTDEEEAVMEERLRALRDDICCDIVIYTDVTANGKEHKYVAADFFDYGGYGWGDDYEGACLFICMDPDDRGWWIANSGPKTMELYTEDIANLMDDVLYEYMVAGKYAEGVNDWITNYSNLYTKGYPFAPEWLPEQGVEPERTHNADAPRIDDAGKSLTEEQVSALGAVAKEISDEYGPDIVVHTTRYDAGMSIYEYAEKYYEYCGYGFGEDYDGIALIVFLNRRGYYRNAVIYGSGAGNDKLSDVNRDRLLGFFTDKADYDDDIYGGLEIYLRKLRSMEKSGRVPRSGFYWTFIVITGMIIGAVVARSSLNKAKKKMETPALSLNADVYLVDGSLTVTGNDKYLSSTTSTTYSPVPRSSSSGGGSSSGSSHRSSYSRSYSSSSGRSHSGSGRRF